MTDPNGGWQLVGRGARVQLDEHKIVETWIDPNKPDNWFGEPKKLHAGPDEFEKLQRRFTVNCHLGEGSFGDVEDVEYTVSEKRVRLARKKIFCRNGMTVDKLLQEGKIMQKVNRHHHVVKFIGSYSKRGRTSEFLYLLSWPVANCSLDNFLGYVDSLRPNRRADDVNEAQRHMSDLGLVYDKLADDSDDEDLEHSSPQRRPLEFLRSTLGCITNALSFCHANKIRHRDIKPHNILVDRGTVLLTDFGISMDTSNEESTIISDRAGSQLWMAPEAYRGDSHSARKAEIFSLGLIFLKILVVLYGAEIRSFDQAIRHYKWNHPELMIQYARMLREKAPLSHSVRDEDDEIATCGPRHILGLLASMLNENPEQRPEAHEVAARLVELGGVGQVYFGCDSCKKSPHFVARILDAMYRWESSQMKNDLEKMHAQLSLTESQRASDIAKAVAESADKAQTELERLRDELCAKRRENEALKSVGSVLEKRVADLQSASRVFESRRNQEAEKRNETIRKYQNENERLKAENEGLHHQLLYPTKRGRQQGKRTANSHSITSHTATKMTTGKATFGTLSSRGEKNRHCRKYSDSSSSQVSRPLQQQQRIKAEQAPPSSYNQLIRSSSPAKSWDLKEGQGFIISYSDALLHGTQQAPRPTIPAVNTSTPNFAIETARSVSCNSEKDPKDKMIVTAGQSSQSSATLFDGTLSRSGSASKLPRLVSHLNGNGTIAVQSTSNSTQIPPKNQQYKLVNRHARQSSYERMLRTSGAGENNTTGNSSTGTQSTISSGYFTSSTGTTSCNSRVHNSVIFEGNSSSNSSVRKSPLLAQDTGGDFTPRSTRIPTPKTIMSSSATPIVMQPRPNLGSTGQDEVKEKEGKIGESFDSGVVMGMAAEKQIRSSHLLLSDEEKHKSEDSFNEFDGNLEEEHIRHEKEHKRSRPRSVSVISCTESYAAASTTAASEAPSIDSMRSYRDVAVASTISSTISKQQHQQSLLYLEEIDKSSGGSDCNKYVEASVTGVAAETTPSPSLVKRVPALPAQRSWAAVVSSAI